jgi:hypothetical protein
MEVSEVTADFSIDCAFSDIDSSFFLSETDLMEDGAMLSDDDDDMDTLLDASFFSASFFFSSVEADEEKDRMFMKEFVVLLS